MIKRYILIFIIVTYIVYILYKITTNYWFIQPVFHYYDLSYYFKPNGTIICNKLAKVNKYCNFEKIRTIEFSSIDNQLMNDIIKFININWSKNYKLTKDSFIPYFKSHNKEPYFGLYYDNNKLVSVFCDIPLIMNVNNKQYNIIYADKLCVDINYRKKGLASQQIETSIYNIEHMEKEVTIALFERYYEPSIVKPNCIYSVYKYEILFDNFDYSNNIAIQCNKKNIKMIYNYINSNNKFDVMILPCLDNIIELIKNKILFIYYITNNNIIDAIYIFEKSSVYLKNTECLNLIGSINYTDNNTFISGFMSALQHIFTNNKNFGYIVIKNISFNNIIIIDNNISIIKKDINAEIDMALYFRNIIIHTIQPKKIFFIN
jgi:hypothetical protein